MELLSTSVWDRSRGGEHRVSACDAVGSLWHSAQGRLGSVTTAPGAVGAPLGREQLPGELEAAPGTEHPVRAEGWG